MCWNLSLPAWTWPASAAPVPPHPFHHHQRCRCNTRCKRSVARHVARCAARCSGGRTAFGTPKQELDGRGWEIGRNSHCAGDEPFRFPMIPLLPLLRTPAPPAWRVHAWDREDRRQGAGYVRKDQAEVPSAERWVLACIEYRKTCLFWSSHQGILLPRQVAFSRHVVTLAVRDCLIHLLHKQHSSQQPHVAPPPLYPLSIFACIPLFLDQSVASALLPATPSLTNRDPASPPV